MTEVVDMERTEDQTQDQSEEEPFEERDDAREDSHRSPSSQRMFTPEPDGVSSSPIKGRIKVADEVVEKVAALAALEIVGVADLGGDFERALETVRDRVGIGAKRANQGVRAHIQDRQVGVDVTIVIEYGHVVMEVASQVKGNVARTVSHMLGMRVDEVNVTVDDVRLPDEGARPTGQDDEDF